MDLSPTLRFSSRSSRSREEGDFSLGQMNWLLGPGTTTRTSFTSLYSYGSNGNNHNQNSNSSDERMNSRQRSSSLKFVEPSIEIQSAAEQPIDVLSQSIKSCIENVFGLYGIEVWRFDDETGKLFNVATSQQSVESGRSECGMHIKRIPQEADHESPSYSPEARDAFERLAYTSRIDYLAPEPVESGCSLAGVLWSETPTSNLLEAFSNRVSSIGYTIHKRVGFLAGLQPIQSADESISWRDVGELVTDPNQPYDARIQLLSKAGFKLAAGIPVDIPGFRGIIIFFANPYSDRRKLCLDNNTQLMNRSACYIAAAAALLVPIKIASGIKNNQSIENWRRLRLKILAIVRFQKPLLVRRSRVTSNLRTSKGSFVLTLERMKSMTREKSFKILSNAATESRRKIATAVVDIQHAAQARCMKWLTKLKGGNASVPPAMPLSQCLWTFVGIAFTLVILARVEQCLLEKTSGHLYLVLPPIGALTTTQWNLTAAPASQPRNAVFSQIIALLTAFSLHQFSSIGPIMRCGLAPAITAALTAKFGIVHAPAGAAALAFSLKKYDFEHNVLFLASVCFAIITAVVINNLSDKRQYPTSWPIIHKFKSLYDRPTDDTARVTAI